MKATFFEFDDARPGSAGASSPKDQGLIDIDEEFTHRVYEQVRCVPCGCVCTYGTIAALAGYQGAAREVGIVMSQVLPEQNLPCQRIVNAQGTLAPDSAFGGADRQRAMLEAESVTFLENGTIDMKRHTWPPSNDPVQESLF